MKLLSFAVHMIGALFLQFHIAGQASAQVAFDPNQSFFIEIPFDTAGVFAGQEKPFGGISAIAYSGKGTDYYLLSDGLPARYYTFSIQVQQSLEVAYKKVTYLAETKVRGEGLAVAGGSMYLSDERDIDQVEKTLVWTLDPSGKMQEIKDLPTRYYGEMYDNSGFEGLAVSPTGKTLFLGIERPLPSSQCRSLTPILKYALSSHAVETFYYPFQWRTDGNGISEILALNDLDVLVIERDYLKAEDRNEVNLYKVVLANPASGNTADCPASGDPVLVPEKVFSFTQGMTLGGRPYKVNNIEGAVFTPDGNFLLLVSDNNFGNKGARTPTQIVALKVKK